MSYEIYYDKQFIKANDKFAPIILQGSSNCFDIGTRTRCGRRAREFYNDTSVTGGKKLATGQEILANVDAFRQEMMGRYPEKPDADNYYSPYSDERFGYFVALAIRSTTHNTRFADYKNWYITGMKKALTVEQLAEEHIFVTVSLYDYNGESEKAVKEAGLPWLGSTTVKTTQELIDTVEKYEQLYGHRFSWNIYLNDAAESRLKWVRRKFFNERKAREYEFVDVDKYYTITIKWHNATYYFVKKTRSGFKYTAYPYKNFATEREAKQFVNSKKSYVELGYELIEEHNRVRTLKKVLNKS